MHILLSILVILCLTAVFVSGDTAVESIFPFGGYFSLPASKSGPGLVIAYNNLEINQLVRNVADYYAEEGYVVFVPNFSENHNSQNTSTDDTCESTQTSEVNTGVVQDLQFTIDSLRNRVEVTNRHVGVLGFGLGGKLAILAAYHTSSDVAVAYYPANLDQALTQSRDLRCPLTLHIAGSESFPVPPLAAAGAEDSAVLTAFHYPGTQGSFAQQGHAQFHKPSALMAHERSVAALKAVLGPHYDLSALWDKHCEYEFVTRDLDATMATMVAEPYVNHIPTMTGGVGQQALRKFYLENFIFSNPPDTALVPISRTVGPTQVVDEMLFTFTHTTEVPWMLPGVAPTGRRVEIPLLAVVKFRGNKLYHEHIYWDQASVLVQVGLLLDSDTQQQQQPLPVAGIATARKLLNESLPSNELLLHR